MLSDLVYTRTVKIVTGPSTPVWEILPLINTYQGANSAILGLVISESAHYECDGVILHKLYRLLHALPTMAKNGGPPAPAKSAFFSGSQFRAVSLYNAIKPNGDEQALAGNVAGLQCELRPFQVGIICVT